MIASLVRRAVPARWRPIGYLSHLALRGSGGCVRVGPFAGTRYVNDSYGSCFIPKVLGIYERELHGFIENVCDSRPTLVVDIGAAEGYYAIGLARRLPGARVVAFELDPHGRHLLATMRTLNGLGARVEIRGRCDATSLATLLREAADPVVVCDCEGAETDILDPVASPELRRTRLLVELHDFIVPGCTDLLRGRFAATHRIETILQSDREASDFPFHTWYTRALPRRYLEWAVSEWRPVRMSWLWLEPRDA